MSAEKVTAPAKEVGSHLLSAAKNIGSLASGVASFVKDEGSKLVGLKADLAGDAALVATIVADVETGNYPSALVALQNLANAAVKTASDVKVVEADAKAAKLIPESGPIAVQTTLPT